MTTHEETREDMVMGSPVDTAVSVARKVDTEVVLWLQTHVWLSVNPPLT